MHFVFENRSLVDFQIGNERKGRELGGDGCIYSFRIDHWSILKERMSEKAAKSEVPGDFLFENLSLVDFLRGNERKGRQIGG